jgi:predicted MFS family arabinose efflux permease
MIVPTLFFLRKINPEEIDYERARGCGSDGHEDKQESKIGALLADKRLLIFVICAVAFHFANAAMLPLLGELLGGDKGRSSMLFMTACVVTTQIFLVLFAVRSARLASSWGRKPLLLIGFAVLPLRGLLYTFTHHPILLISIQILDGIGAVVFGVVSVLVIADLTRGTGRFNLAQGVIATAIGIGASLSQVSAGTIAHHYGFNAAFLFLATIATGGLILFMVFMPETLIRKK